eukprot:scaffold20000_cov112-Isochrysis_galbana.AAC.2
MPCCTGERGLSDLSASSGALSFCLGGEWGGLRGLSGDRIGCLEQRRSRSARCTLLPSAPSPPRQPIPALRRRSPQYERVLTELDESKAANRVDALAKGAGAQATATAALHTTGPAVEG